MKNFTPSATRVAFAGLIAPAVVLAIAGTLIGVGMRKPLAADASSFPTDTDGDGLVDRQERILGTLPTEADSDHDGFSDAEELARGSSPINRRYQPEQSGLQTGMTARGEGNRLHALIAVYLPHGNYQDIDLEIGLLLGQRLVKLPRWMLLAWGTVEFASAADPHAAIALVDFPFGRDWVDGPGHLSMFATVSRRGSGIVSAAATIDLFSNGGVILLAMPDPTFFPTGDSNQQAVSSGPGSIYVPLTGSDDIPVGWEPGEICYQTSESVGVDGAKVIHHVVTADCQGGWEGACPPDCHASVGTTYTTVDPTLLLGG